MGEKRSSVCSIHVHTWNPGCGGATWDSHSAGIPVATTVVESPAPSTPAEWSHKEGGDANVTWG